jgi:hypothetical protein
MRVGHQNAEGDLNWAVVDPSLDVGDEPADEQSQSNAATDEPRKGQDAAQESRCLLMDHEGCGELKSEQASSVVDETLPFENIDEPARQPDTPGDGGGSNGVSGGDNGAEHQSEAPVKTDKNRWRNQGDGYDCESRQAEGQKRYADDVISEVTPGSGPGSRVEQWGENDQKNKIGIESDLRYARYEANDQSTDDHDDRVGGSDPLGEKSENDDENQQEKKDELDPPDFTHSAPPLF